jgi:hypothetical protein
VGMPGRRCLPLEVGKEFFEVLDALRCKGDGGSSSPTNCAPDIYKQLLIYNSGPTLVSDSTTCT